MRVVVSVVERDLPALGWHTSSGADLLTSFAGAAQSSGLRVADCRPARRADVAELGSSWAKRLGIPERRPAWLLSADKP